MRGQLRQTKAPIFCCHGNFKSAYLFFDFLFWMFLGNNKKDTRVKAQVWFAVDRKANKASAVWFQKSENISNCENIFSDSYSFLFSFCSRLLGSPSCAEHVFTCACVLQNVVHQTMCLRSFFMVRSAQKKNKKQKNKTKQNKTKKQKQKTRMFFFPMTQRICCLLGLLVYFQKFWRRALFWSLLFEQTRTRTARNQKS